jgi:pyruvate carboxylase
MKQIRKLLVANRSEIAIRVFRTAHELGIRTVAIYSHEDRFALHRFKADEAYLIGKQGEPIRAYLDIDGIIAICKANGVDAIHPGYGFLSENPKLRAACDANGIIFVGPQEDSLNKLGDKTSAREIADIAQVPILAGTNKALQTLDEAKQVAASLGYPIILKAAHGGGGRGMRVVNAESELGPQLESAQREAFAAFGSGDVFIEKFITRARHIEVQIMGDSHGNLVHLWERDCSVQRRHQKVVEIAPAPNLDPKVRQGLCDAAIKIGRAANYENAGTVEFLVDADTNKFYFIEVNPRIQVEHTVTEEVTGIDIVRTQILIAQGYKLSDPELGLGNQADIQTSGYCIQSRVTTEDPENRFVPDYGRIMAYRSAGGPGIRLDGGTAFSGAVVTPYYDSLLVKVCSRGRTFRAAAGRMERCLQEFRIRGVKTNIPFLVNLITHPKFLAGECTTRFIDEATELFQFTARQDRASRLLQYLGDTIVNGNALVKDRPKATVRTPATLPAYDLLTPPPAGMRQRWKQLGSQKFSKWLVEQKELLFMDTTMRDAHQSLLATRMRSYDMVRIADAYARLTPNLFALEMWGGATFDTSMRFLKECPWQRLADLRDKIPNILFQMLLRASNAVGYTNYPDNVVESFVKETVDAGIDILRVFDPLNWVPNMKVAMDAVNKYGGICEAAICYTGDILDPKRPKYNLKYYVELAKELEKMGATILAIKDMAGLCKPYSAELLIKTLKQEIGIPIHFHTHDTSGASAASIIKGADVGLDIADGALAPFSGLTSQPNLNALVDAVRNTPRASSVDHEQLRYLAHYWQTVRQYYKPFESDMEAADADLYLHEMPGGQFTNLQEQARALGLAHRWEEVCQAYAEVNQLVGDIVKVTPTSKSVGDLALFLVTNNLTCKELMASDREFSFPESVIDLVGGRMGQPPGGWPAAVQKRILRDIKPVTGRPGDGLPPADFTKAAEAVKKITGKEASPREAVTHILYPKVYSDFLLHVQKYGNTSILPTPVWLYGTQIGEELTVEIEKGKTLILKLLTVGEPHEDGTRTVFFELNGQPRSVKVVDRSLEGEVTRRPKADPTNAKHVAAPMPGAVVSVAVKPGDQVVKGAKLFSLEAMKMETTIFADQDGRIADVLVKPGTPVEAGELMAVLE